MDVQTPHIMKATPSLRNRALPSRLPVIVAVLLAACGSTQAAVTIASNVTSAGGVFTYSYSVTNSGSMDLAFIDIPIGQSLVTNLTAPTGFGIFADSGLVSFFEDADFFTPQTFAPNSTVQFFTYDSLVAPVSVTFSAQDTNGDVFTGTTQSAVPEPSSLLLIAASALPLLATRRRRIG